MAIGCTLAGCSNSPYPGDTGDPTITYYTSYEEAPKSLDPTVAYSFDDGEFLALCYEGLFQYDYLKRPLELVPELAREVPSPITLRDASGATTGVLYRVELRPGVRFVDDPCFPGATGRELTAADIDFAFRRAADPAVHCPVREPLSFIKGFHAYGERARAVRRELVARGLDPSAGHFKTMVDELGPMAGVRVTGPLSLEIELSQPYPQILYWLAMRFISAIPHEAVDYYNDQRPRDAGQGPQRFAERPVGTGAYRFNWRLTRRDSIVVMDRNENWWGLQANPETTPTACFPMHPGEPSDITSGAWTAEDAGRTLARLDRIVFSLEIEQLSRFSKFAQGYFDQSRIPREMFSQVMQSTGELTPSMVQKGVRLSRGVDSELRYVGFNMDDDEIGEPTKFHETAREAEREKWIGRNRAIRQAMSLAIDSTEYRRIFYNSLGRDAQSPLPPGIAGYEEGYRNPVRAYEPSLEKARNLLASVGCSNGVDSSTGKPLSFTFDIGLTDTRYVVMCQYLADAWRKLGLDVKIDATDYNKFQDKVYKGRYQIFEWGWMMDYPDPENFLFLLHGPNSGKYNSQSPNHARYENPRFDFLFKKMENLRDGESVSWDEPDPTTNTIRKVSLTRGQIIHELLALLEVDCPWIPLIYREIPTLAHEWVKNVKPHPLSFAFAKYIRLDKPTRDKKRQQWNKPILWPALVLAAGLLAGLIPAIVVARRARL